MINHGTLSGYYAHRRLNAPPCDPCRAAMNQYMREYRKKNGTSKNRINEKVRRRAMAALRENHAIEYKRLLKKCREEVLAEELL